MYLKAGGCFWLLSVALYSCTCRCCLTQSSLQKEQPSRTWRTQTECLLVEMILQRDRKLSVLFVLFMSTGCPKKKSSQPILGHQNFLNWLVLLTAVVCNVTEIKLRSTSSLSWVMQLGKTWGWEDPVCVSKYLLFSNYLSWANRWY